MQRVFIASCHYSLIRILAPIQQVVRARQTETHAGAALGGRQQKRGGKHNIGAALSHTRTHVRPVHGRANEIKATCLGCWNYFGLQATGEIKFVFTCRREAGCKTFWRNWCSLCFCSARMYTKHTRRHSPFSAACAWECKLSFGERPPLRRNPLQWINYRAWCCISKTLRRFSMTIALKIND